MSGSVRHLLNREGRYFARLVIPKNLRPFMNGKTELRTPLGPDRREALKRLPGAVALLQNDIALGEERARKAGRKNASPSRYTLAPDQIALRNYQDRLEFHEEIRNTHPIYAQLDIDDVLARRLKEGFSGQLDDEALRVLVGRRVEHFRALGNTDAEFGTTEWRIVARAICVSDYEAMSRAAERHEGDWTGQPTHPLLTNAQPVPVEEPEHITFAEIIDAEVKWRTSGKDARGVKPATIRQFRHAAGDFAAFRKSDNAVTVTVEEGEAWIAHLVAQGKLTAKTTKVRVVNVATILSWGAKRFRGKMPPTNPLLGVEKPEGAHVPPEERTFTMEEARKILTVAKTEEKPKFRFIPWLTAYSGARVSEIAQLRPEDFFTIGDDWFYRINTKGGKGVKTESSIRRVPVHPDLLALGLIEFVQDAPVGKPLFGTSVQPRISEWMRGTVKLRRDYMAPNHSWRHLFEDLCTLGGVIDDARSYMTGRSTRSSRDRYGRSEVALPGLAREMAKVPSILAI